MESIGSLLSEKYHLVLHAVVQNGTELPFELSAFKVPSLWNTPTAYAIPITGFLLYALVCRILRFRGRDKLHKKYHYPTRESLAKMTNNDAQAIGQYLGQMEFPWIYTTALQFALFKTYGIPTISKILVQTKQFTTPENASKRYTDTAVIVDEMVGNPPTSTRCIKSIARLNYLHSRHPQILNSDFLYTLAQFILVPIEWINTYEWRQLSEMEMCAIATLWKGIGDGMEIRYDELRRAKVGWKDGIEFLEDIREWAEEYEREFMVPAETNGKTGDETVKLLLWLVPDFLSSYLKPILSVLMGERVRKAMIYPPPGPLYTHLTHTLLSTRRLLLHHLSPPRPTLLRFTTLQPTPNPLTNRYNYQNYQAHPYYVYPTFWKRWGPEAWLVWILGGIVPGSKRGLWGRRRVGDGELEEEGYLIEDVGPVRARGMGREKVEGWEGKLRGERVGGCPFGVVGGLGGKV